jgi:hypothetical protein
MVTGGGLLSTLVSTETPPNVDNIEGNNVGVAEAKKGFVEEDVSEEGVKEGIVEEDMSQEGVKGVKGMGAGGAMVLTAVLTSSGLGHGNGTLLATYSPHEMTAAQHETQRGADPIIASPSHRF